MKLLFHLDPFLAAADEAGGVADVRTWTPVFLMAAASEARKRGAGEFRVLLSGRHLPLGDPGGRLERHGVSVIAIDDGEVGELVRGAGVGPERVSAPGYADGGFVERYGRLLAEKLGGWTPDMVVSSGGVPQYLGAIFPETPCVGQQPTGQAGLIRRAEILPVMTRTNAIRVERTGAFLADVVLDGEAKRDLARFKSSFRKRLAGPGAFGRSLLDPGGGFRKILFHRGDPGRLDGMIAALPADCAVAFLSTRPGPGDGSFMKDDPRLIRLDGRRDPPENFFLKVLDACDALLCGDSELIFAAAALGKPAFRLDGNGDAIERGPGDLDGWLADDHAGRPPDDGADRYLFHLLTHRISMAFLAAGPDIAWNHYSAMLRNYRAGEAGARFSPVASTLEEAVLDVRLATMVPRREDREGRVDEYERIRGAVLDPGVRNVGFDVFDTALWRPTPRPRDLFELMESCCGELVDSRMFNFARIRTAAEKLARARAGGEIAHAAIYAAFAELTGLSADIVGKLSAAELALEERVLSPRRSVLSLFKLAKSLNKKTFFVSDMYLPAEFLSGILEKRGYAGAEGVFVSCERGAAKGGRGRLFQVAVDELAIAPGETVFIGDNEESDVLNGCRYGLKTFHYPSAFSRFAAIPAFRECFSYCFDGAHATFLHLGLLANVLFDNPFIPFNPGGSVNDSLEVFGYAAVGPAALATTNWLIAETARDGRDLISFIARDGYLVKEVYDRINRELRGGTLAASGYLRLSRLATVPCLLSSRSYILLFDDLYSSGVTVERLFRERLGLDCREGFLGEALAAASLSPEDSTARKKSALLGFAAANADKLRAMRSSDPVVGYCRQEIASAKNPAWFDLGLRATGNRLIADALDISWPGYLFKRAHFKYGDDAVSAFTGIRANAFAANVRDVPPEFFEAVFSNPHEKTVTGYAREDGRWIPLVGEAPRDGSRDAIARVQAAALDFCDDAMRLYGDNIFYMTAVAPELFTRALEFAATNTADFLYLDSRMTHENQIGEKRRIIPERMRKRIAGRYRREKRGAGSSRKLSKLALLGLLFLGGEDASLAFWKKMKRLSRTSGNPLYRIVFKIMVWLDSK